MPRFFLLTLFAATLVCAPLGAQQLRNLPKQNKAKQRGVAPIPGPVLRRFLQMSPNERSRALGQLPEPRRAQMEQRLRRLDQMRPEDREAVLRRSEALEAIPPVRRPLVRAAIQRLRTMPEARRKAYLASDDAKVRFEPEELDLLRDVSGLDLDEQ